MMETREITVTIHREPEKRDDLLATLLIVVLAALAFTAGRTHNGARRSRR